MRSLIQKLLSLLTNHREILNLTHAILHIQIENNQHHRHKWTLIGAVKAPDTAVSCHLSL